MGEGNPFLLFLADFLYEFLEDLALDLWNLTFGSHGALLIISDA